VIDADIVTVHLLEDLASLAYLQSSAMGLRVYEMLGFRTVEDWSVWMSPGAD
jgi:hypothetical protein